MSRRSVLVVGVLPGPVNGMTLVTQRVVDACGKSGPVSICDVGRWYEPGLSARRWKLRKALGTIWSLAAIVRCRGSKHSIYLVSNSSAALWLTALQLVAARTTGCRTVLHHHTSESMRKLAMRVVGLVGGAEVLHVVSCPALDAELREAVGGQARSMLLKPTLVLGEPGEPAATNRPAGEPFVIGHLSNLTMAKGVGDVIETLRSLLRRGLDVRCDLAGPLTTAVERGLILDAQDEFGDRLRVLGPLYGEDKGRFYRGLDAFVFPSRYPNESWAIVLDEALAAGVPVLTTDFPGAERVVGRAGIVVAPDHFVQQACDRLSDWIADPAGHAKASSAASELAIDLREAAVGELSGLVAELSGAGGPEGRRGSEREGLMW